eukprot:GFUD01087675.1.p1 GENE.GFUD01087675.1~~GFUD01087675.1.p1  ORF type:complete len:356 (+),score=75.65 GFUD01087675.1:77-1144(+)
MANPGTSAHLVDESKDADSWSYSDNAPATEYKHVWTISNFYDNLKMETGGEIHSSEFSIATSRSGNKKTTWQLGLRNQNRESDFPCLVIRSNDLVISLCMKKLEHDMSISVSAKVGILNKDGRKIHLNDIQHTFNNNDLRSRGVEVMTLGGLLAYGRSNKLTFICDISIRGEIITKQSAKYECKESEITDVLVTQLGSLFDKGQFTDCSILSGEQEFRCHKNILCARSSVFEAMFTANMEEKRSSKVTIKDIKEDIVKAMLKYIYTGKIEGLGDDQFHRLFYAADKYDLKELKDVCFKNMSANIDTENALELLILADQHNATKLRNKKEFEDQPGWLDNMMKSHPKMLAEMFKCA